MNTKAKEILTPYDMNGLTLSNRLAVAPMTRVSATESGCATAIMASYYERFARGGFGLVITEGMYTDQLYSQGYRFQPGISDDEQAHAWRQVVDRVHVHGSAVFAQIMHSGALSFDNRFVKDLVAPSSIRPHGKRSERYYGQGDFPVPIAMSDEQIADAVDGFAQAGRLAVATSGFDGIEIHGANGYLLDQFLTDYSNHRDDRWGGSVEQRLALTLEVVRAVRQAAGTAPVGVRISQVKVNDAAHKWAGGEAAAEVVFGSLADAGVDFIHVTEPEAWAPAFADVGPSLVQLARRFAPSTSIIANGGLGDSERARDSLGDGADIVAIGKHALANPDLPIKFREGVPLSEFDPAILSPIANIKASETVLA